MVHQPVESIVVRSWRLLNGNWAIVVPGLVVGLAASLLTALLGVGVPHSAAEAPGIVVGGGFASIVWLAATVISITYTTGMAGAAWRTGTTTFADGAGALRENWVNVVLAMLGITFFGVIAAFLSLPTLGLSLLAFTLFFMYTIPATILGHRNAAGAIGDSWHTVLTHFVQTMLILLVIVAVAFALLLPTVFIGIIPFFGPLLSATLVQGACAYFTLMIVGEYLDAEHAV